MHCDILFIGAGPSGYIGAIEAAKLGKKVVVCEKSAVGGTCLNVGCIPSKALLHATEIIHTVKHEAPHFGFEATGSLNFSKLMEFKNAAITKFQKGIEFLFKRHKITLLRGCAKFLDAKRVSIDGQTIEAGKIVIATGSKILTLPFLPIDEKEILSSTGALDLQEPPKSMIVIGGGVIGLELGSVYARLGTKVTIVEAKDRLVSEFDKHVSKTLLSVLQKQGIKIHLDAFVQELKPKKLGFQEVSLSVEKKGELQNMQAEKILVCIGRAPHTDHLDLNEAGIQIDKRGFVAINDRFETSVQNIYAIGDCCSNPMLAHKGSHEGVVLAHALCGVKEKIEYCSIPSVIYISPEIASVGFTQEELEAKDVSFKSSIFPIQANSRYGAIGGSTPGFVKLLSNLDESGLLGMHIMSPCAGEMIMEGVLAISENLPIASLKNAIHAHPTFSESIYEAALSLKASK